MSKEVLIREQDVQTPISDVRPEELLNSVVEAVRRDSQDAAAKFLSESIVPHGGE